MANKTAILKELDFVTDRLSVQVRTTALGALLFAWGLLIGDSKTARSVAGQAKWHLIGIGAAAILTIFLDFLQYLAGYFSAKETYEAMVQADSDEGEYKNTYWYTLRKTFFSLKIVSLMATVLWLLFTLGHWLIISYDYIQSLLAQGRPIHLGFPSPIYSHVSHQVCAMYEPNSSTWP